MQGEQVELSSFLLRSAVNVIILMDQTGIDSGKASRGADELLLSSAATIEMVKNMGSISRLIDSPEEVPISESRESDQVASKGTKGKGFFTLPL